jgi:PAS domain S-box-containing protein
VAQRLLGADRFIGLAHIVDGRLFGTSVLALKKGQRDPPEEWLESLAHTLAVFLRRRIAEEQLRESEIFARSTLDSLSAHIAIIDESGVIVAVNRAWREFAEENPPLRGNVCEGANYLDICDGAASEAPEAAKFAGAIRTILRGSAEEFEMEYSCHSPVQQRWFVGRVTRFPGFTVPRVVVAHEDITERVRLEENLRTEATNLEAVFSSSPLVMMILDESTNIVRVNEAAIGLCGCDPAEILHHRPGDVLGCAYGASTPRGCGHAPECPLCPIRKGIEGLIAEGGSIDGAEITLPLLRDGELRDVCLSVFARPVSIDHRRHACVTVEDITERKRAEAALRESEQQFRLLFQHLHAGVVVHAPDTKILLANEQSCELLGLSVAQIVGKTAIDPSWRFVREDETAMPIEEYPVQRVLATRRPIRDLVVGVDRPSTKDRVWVLVNAFPELDAHERLRQAVVTFVDITALKRAEAEHQMLEEQLRTSQKMEAIGSLAGGVAHDFNNLLSVILSYTEFAMDGVRDGDPLKSDLLEVKKAGERAVALTRQLLAFSRKQVLQPAMLDLNQVAEGVEKLLRRIIGEDIDFVQVLAPDLGAVHADPGQIEQVLMNLAVNARDAMPEGGKLTIETSNVEIDEEYAAFHGAVKPGSYVRLAVSDTGCGMDEQTKARLFEPFFTTKEKGKGTGLGLSTVYGIIKQSGGNIWVYSEVGKGTTFKICLPRDFSATASTTIKPSATTKRSKGTETILVVEDEEALRKVALRTLGASGYKVLTASDGEEALLVSARHVGDIHMLLTDVVMPGMSGRALAQQLSKARPTVKVLYMSGYTDNAIVHRGALDPGTHFLAKPFTSAGLTRKVREVLDEGMPRPPR